MAKKITIAKVRTLAAERGVTVHSKRCPSTNTVLAFTFACGHEAKQSYRMFRDNKDGICFQCRQVRIARPTKNLSVEERAARLPAIRLSTYRIWAREVFARDGKACVISGRTDKLVAHHIWPYNAYPERRTDPTNGVTLHRDLHNEFHARYGHNCTRTDFDAFYQEKMNG